MFAPRVSQRRRRLACICPVLATACSLSSNRWFSSHISAPSILRGAGSLWGTIPFGFHLNLGGVTLHKLPWSKPHVEVDQFGGIDSFIEIRATRTDVRRASTPEVWPNAPGRAKLLPRSEAFPEATHNMFVAIIHGDDMGHPNPLLFAGANQKWPQEDQLLPRAGPQMHLERQARAPAGGRGR